MPNHPPPACVRHRDRVATHAPQGLLCCDECWEAYHDEYLRSQQRNDLSLRSRPVLQELIRASADAFEAANQST